MNKACCWIVISACFVMCISSPVMAFNLEVPAEPWDEYRQQFKTYSKQLLASYDRAFVDDYEGAIREVDKAIEALPDEGIGLSERAKYNRILGNSVAAENDFKAALRLFAQAIEQYRPGGDVKSKKTATRKTNPGDAGRLVTTLRYQRGEAYYNFELYRQANDDFAVACQGGHSVACSRIWDIKAIEKRGVQWVPLAARQYYDRKRVAFLSPSIARVWVRREDPQPVQPESGSENYVQQLLELNCSTREFRLIEAQVISNGTMSITEKVAEARFARPIVGSAPGKLIIAVCTYAKPKRSTPDVSDRMLK